MVKDGGGRRKIVQVTLRHFFLDLLQNLRHYVTRAIIGYYEFLNFFIFSTAINSNIICNKNSSTNFSNKILIIIHFDLYLIFRSQSQMKKKKTSF